MMLMGSVGCWTCVERPAGPCGADTKLYDASGVLPAPSCAVVSGGWDTWRGFCVDVGVTSRRGADPAEHQSAVQHPVCCTSAACNGIEMGRSEVGGTHAFSASWLRLKGRALKDGQKHATLPV